MKLLFTLFTFLLSVSGICQKGDYLVKNNGDTVWGEINVRNKAFYVHGASPSVIKADNVSWVKCSRYKGHIVVPVHLITYTENLGELHIDYVEKGEVDTVLILDEIYTSPKINLYYTTDDFKVPFYFYKTPSDSKPIQLVIRYHLQGGLANYANNRAKYRGEKSKIQIVEDKGYVNQLYAVMGSCKKIPQTMWDLLSYRDYSLKQIAKKYNKCD